MHREGGVCMPPQPFVTDLTKTNPEKWREKTQKNHSEEKQISERMKSEKMSNSSSARNKQAVCSSTSQQAVVVVVAEVVAVRSK